MGRGTAAANFSLGQSCCLSRTYNHNVAYVEAFYSASHFLLRCVHLGCIPLNSGRPTLKQNIAQFAHKQLTFYRSSVDVKQTSSQSCVVTLIAAQLNLEHPPLIFYHVYL